MRVTVWFCTLLLALLALGAPAPLSAQVRITVAFGPPALPVYEQPICPGDGYIWTPGYWAWDSDAYDYYWVPGTWVLPPEVGFLWTPPWWGWDDGVFVFYPGYWGPLVGFYGGIDYGFGYFGSGFVGGRWEHDHFFYNRAVTNINVVNIHNVYNERVNDVTVNRISYNGGPDGIVAHPRPEDERAAHGRHIGLVKAQTEQIDQARQNRELRASVNRGRPPIAATRRPGKFSGHEVVAAREAGAPYHPPVKPRSTIENRGRPAVHPNELPALERPAPPNTGNAQRDEEYWKQQQELFNEQTRERENMQREQDLEHQEMERRNPSQGERQHMEMRHQQQTQELQRRQMQQMERMHERQRPGRPR
jgi:WXXGXW repeat (2 copies)